MSLFFRMIARRTLFMPCMHAGRGMATIAYTAPEGIDGPSTPATDVWSFGIMLNQMVTGKVAKGPQLL